MKILVFGATGQTGKEVVTQALQQGDEVVAFVRDRNKFTVKDPNVSLVTGDVTNAESVKKAVSQVDVVILALGSKPDSSPTALADGTKNIIKSMTENGIRRLVVMSSYPMSGAPEGIAFLHAVGMTDEKIAPMQPMIDDKIHQEKAVKESGLDWTIVRPLMLTDGPKTGSYRTGESIAVKPGDSISRADVADFLLKASTSSEWVGKIVILSN